MNVFHPDYEPGTVPDDIEARYVPEGSIKNVEAYGEDNADHTVFINGQPIGHRRIYMDQCYIEPEIPLFTKNGAERLIKMFKSLYQEYPFKVRKFSYNGFFGKLESEFAPYKARFIKWSGDPGVAVMKCSDGKKRLIPTFAMPGTSWCLPNDMTRVENDGKVVFFGAPSQS